MTSIQAHAAPAANMLPYHILDETESWFFVTPTIDGNPNYLRFPSTTRTPMILLMVG